MKITRKILENLIKEEVAKVLVNEGRGGRTSQEYIKIVLKNNGVENAILYLAYALGDLRDSVIEIDKSRMKHARDGHGVAIDGE